MSVKLEDVTFGELEVGDKFVQAIPNFSIGVIYTKIEVKLIDDGRTLTNASWQEKGIKGTSYALLIDEEGVRKIIAEDT